MNQPRVLIRITPNGHVEFEVEGMPGNTCEDITKVLTSAKGMEVVDQKLTAETFIQDTRPDYIYKQED